MIAVLTRRPDIRPLVVGMMSVMLLIGIVVWVATNIQQDVDLPISTPLQISTLLQISEDGAVSQVMQYINAATPCLAGDSGFTVTRLRDSNIREVAHGSFAWHVYPSGLVAPQFIHSC